MKSSAPLCRLALVVVPRPEEHALLDVALGAGDVATVFLVPAGGEDRDVSILAEFVRLAQSRNVAVLVAGDSDLFIRAGADGVHVTWSTDIGSRVLAARKAAGRDLMIGGDAGNSRHDAMEIGEAGADYVAFGKPPRIEDQQTALEHRLELVAWWSEVFEVPVVAFGAGTVEEAHALAAAGADFVAVSFPEDLTVDAVVDWMRTLESAIRVAR